MQNILEEIKSVRGVTGVIIWDKKTLSSHQLLPASFSPSAIKSTCSKMMKLSQDLNPPAELRLFHKNGNATVLNRSSSIILILGRDDLNFSLLDLVLSSIPLRLEKLLNPQSAKKLNFSPLNQEKTNHLIEAMNLVSSHLTDNIGAYSVTQKLRQAKDKLITRYSFMANLFVDNNAKISTVKGKEGIWSGEIVLAFAKWIVLLERLALKKGRGIDLKKTTLPLKKALEEMGFYFTFENIKRNIKKRRG